MGFRIDHGDRAADLGGHPKLFAVGSIFGKAWPAVDQDIRDDFICLGVDEMRHVGRFRRVHHDAAVRTDPHAFRLDADRHFSKDLVRLDIDGHGQQVFPHAPKNGQNTMRGDARHRLLKVVIIL